VVIIRRAAARAAAEAVGGGPDASVVEPDGAVAHGLHLAIIIIAAQVDVSEHDAGAWHGVAAGEPDGLGAARRAGDVTVRHVGDGHGGGLVGAGAAAVAATGGHVAVELVDDDGVVDAVHVHVREAHAADVAGAALPRLDPDPVLRAADPRAVERHVRHRRERAALAQAADADAVAGAAVDVPHLDAEAAVDDGDAVVAGADAAALDGDGGGVGDVDAVRVGAVLGGVDAQPAHAHAAGPGHRHVHLLRVPHAEAAHAHATARVDRHRRRRTPARLQQERAPSPAARAACQWREQRSGRIMHRWTYVRWTC